MPSRRLQQIDAWTQRRVGRRAFVVPHPIILGGGLDLQTPPFQMKPGVCRLAQNFECDIFGGYRRIGGYERFDGRAAPSAATYQVVACSSITGGAVGNTLTGATSGATGQVIAITATYFVVTKVVGTYQAENLNVGAGTIAVSTGAGTIGGASTPLLDATYTNLAADVYRALISALPGSGKVLGVWLYNDITYGFRNNAGGTAAAMFKSTASGWSAVALGRELAFTGGTSSAVADGATITGATSGATAVIGRQAIESGTISGSTAAGHFFFAATVGGPFQNGENLQVGGVTKAVANGADAAITLLPDGRYDFCNYNFTGSTNTKRMYGCDGVNHGFEFDGTTFVKIYTGMATDTPQHVAGHLYMLFFSFFGSLQHSSPGFPYQWTVVTGAGEMAPGDTITGLVALPATTTAASLAVFTTERLHIVYGASSSTLSMVPYDTQLGAVAFTAQHAADTFFLDWRGVASLSTTQQFGNFSHAWVTNQMQDQLKAWRGAAIASAVSRDRNEYRLFFTNNYVLYVTIKDAKVVGLMPILLADTPRCAFAGLKSDNSELCMFGSDNGFVFQMDMGTSFDGADIEAYTYLAYNFEGSYRTLKRFRSGALEISGDGYANFSLVYTLGYGASDIIQPGTQALITNFQATFWDTGIWDALSWDGQTIGPVPFDLDGESENISFGIQCTADYIKPFTVSGGVIQASLRRELRG